MTSTHTRSTRGASGSSSTCYFMAGKGLSGAFASTLSILFQHGRENTHYDNLPRASLLCVGTV